jgi:hypothetical protein
VKSQKENTVKQMRRLYRIGALVGAILLPIGAVLVTGTTEAWAATPYQYCTAGPDANLACLNAWGGGPYVNVEESNNPNIQNNRFQVLPEANGYYQIQFVGGGQYNNYCIGDAGNVPGNADTGLVVCNTIAGGAGWGTLFRDRSNLCGSTGYGPFAYYNSHWKGYLGPVDGFVNGSHFYLNKPNLVCFATAPTN